MMVYDCSALFCLFIVPRPGSSDKDFRGHLPRTCTCTLTRCLSNSALVSFAADHLADSRSKSRVKLLGAATWDA